MKLNLGTPLSRGEMKNVIGGKLPAGQATCTYSGSCAKWPDSQVYDQDDSDTANGQQAHADNACMGLGSCCTDVDCPGAD